MICGSFSSFSSHLTDSIFALCSADSWIAAITPMFPTFFPNTTREWPRFAIRWLMTDNSNKTAGANSSHIWSGPPHTGNEGSKPCFSLEEGLVDGLIHHSSLCISWYCCTNVNPKNSNIGGHPSITKITWQQNGRGSEGDRIISRLRKSNKRDKSSHS